MLYYKDLTKEQKLNICNGCGSKGGFVKVPNFLFLASCNHHDFLYWIGGSETDRKIADDKFYKYMKKDVKAEKKICKKIYYKSWAYTYYKMVCIFGKKYFNYKVVVKNGSI